MLRFEGLDPNDEADASLLLKTQMGILKGHGRLHSVYCFIRIRSGNLNDLKEFTKLLKPGNALTQYGAARKHSLNPAIQEMFLSVSLSSSGFTKLQTSNKPTDIGFLRGMKWASEHVLGDPPATSWYPFFGSDVDILVCAASDEISDVKKVVDFIQEGAATKRIDIELLSINGIKRTDSHGLPQEFFGFVDGISQPLFLRYDIAKYVSDVGVAKYDPSFDPRYLTLIPFPTPSEGYGSYLVVRCLEQNEVLFNTSMNSISTDLKAAPEYIGAQIMGRYPDGTPLALSSTPTNPAGKANDFDYAGDPMGGRCPLHSHVRKMNQRTNDELDQYRVLARRGILYDQDLGNGRAHGLLFLGYQQDIGRQFEFLQSRWANDPEFPPIRKVGIDPVIGATEKAANVGQRWVSDWGVGNHGIQTFVSKLTTLRGGEYFFSPPPSFFASL